MERREINRNMAQKKIDKAEIGFWAMSVSSVVLALSSFSFASDARNLRNEEVIWNTNVSSEEMNHYLSEEKERKINQAYEKDQFAMYLMGLAWVVFMTQRRIENQRKYLTEPRDTIKQ